MSAASIRRRAIEAALAEARVESIARRRLGTKMSAADIAAKKLGLSSGTIYKHITDTHRARVAAAKARAASAETSGIAA